MGIEQVTTDGFRVCQELPQKVRAAVLKAERGAIGDMVRNGLAGPRQCVPLAVVACAHLNREFYFSGVPWRATIAAGSAMFRRIARADAILAGEDDREMFSYMWEPEHPASAEAMGNGYLPEVHAWAVIRPKKKTSRVIETATGRSVALGGATPWVVDYSAHYVPDAFYADRAAGRADGEWHAPRLELPHVAPYMFPVSGPAEAAEAHLAMPALYRPSLRATYVVILAARALFHKRTVTCSAGDPWTFGALWMRDRGDVGNNRTDKFPRGLSPAVAFGLATHAINEFRRRGTVRSHPDGRNVSFFPRGVFLRPEGAPPSEGATIFDEPEHDREGGLFDE